MFSQMTLKRLCKTTHCRASKKIYIKIMQHLKYKNSNNRNEYSPKSLIKQIPQMCTIKV